MPFPRRADALSTWGFRLLVIFILVDYARPQDLIKPLAILRPALLTTGALVALLLFELQKIPWRHPVLMLYLGLLAFMALWVPVATNNYWALMTLIALAQWAVFLAGCVIYLDRPERVRGMLSIWFGCAVFQALWALSHDGRGLGAYFGDENDVCLFLEMMIPFGLALASSARTRVRSAVIYAGIALLLLGAVATQSRGGFVGLVAVVAAIIALSANRGRLIAMAAVAAVILALLAPSEYVDEIRTITDSSNSTAQARMRMWTTATDIWKDHPFLGVGQGNVPWVFGMYEEYDVYRDRSYAGRPVHSALMTVLPELGLLGLGIYAALAVYLARMGFRVSRAARRMRLRGLDATSRALPQALAGYLAASLFISTLYYPHFYYLLALGLVLELQAQRIWRARVRSRQAPPAPGGEPVQS